MQTEQVLIPIALGGGKEGGEGRREGGREGVEERGREGREGVLRAKYHTREM